MTPDPRATVLHGLARVLEAHRGGPGRAGLEALRLLRMAGATWRDLLGPPFVPGDEYPLLLLTYGYVPPAMSDCGRAVLTLMHLASPFEAATAAVLANKPDPTAADRQHLASMAWKLLAARDAALAPAAFNLSRSA